MCIYTCNICMSLSLSIYIYMAECVYIYIYTYTQINKYIIVCIYIYIHIYIYILAAGITPCGGEVLHACLKMSRTKHPIRTMSHLTADVVVLSYCCSNTTTHHTRCLNKPHKKHKHMTAQVSMITHSG